LVASIIKDRMKSYTEYLQKQFEILGAIVFGHFSYTFIAKMFHWHMQINCYDYYCTFSLVFIIVGPILRYLYDNYL
jgi:hypothetical protein